MGRKLKREKVIGKLTATWSVLTKTKWKSVGACLRWNACPSCELWNPDGFPPAERGALPQLGRPRLAGADTWVLVGLGAHRLREEKCGAWDLARCCLCPQSRVTPQRCAGPPAFSPFQDAVVDQEKEAGFEPCRFVRTSWEKRWYWGVARWWELPAGHEVSSSDF